MANQLRQSKRTATKTIPNLFLRGDTWYFNRMKDGVRKPKSTGQQNQKNAILIRDAWVAQQNRDGVEAVIGRKAPKAASPGFAAFVQTLSAERVGAVKHARADKDFVKNITPALAFFGNTPLDDVTTTQCEAFIRFVNALPRRKGAGLYSANVRINFITAARSIFAAAKHAKAMDEADPWVTAKRADVPKGTIRERVVSLDEQRATYAAMPGEDQRAFVVLIGAGLRESELLRLESRHCDFVSGWIVLTGDIVKGKVRKTPDEAGGRRIPMAPAVKAALLAQIAARREGLGSGTARPATSPRLWNMSASMLSQRFAEARERAGVDPFTEHDLRRTFGTRCAEAGIKAHQLQAWMGHANIATTMKFYVHEQRTESYALMQRVDIGLKDLKFDAPVSTEVDTPKDEG